MGDPVTGLLIALGLDPIAFVVSLGLAIATTALTSSAPARGRLWAAVLLIGGSLLLADRVHAQRQEPAVIILCASGGVSRLNDGGFLASGGTCVLHDREGGHASADSIVVYDSSLGSP